MLYSNILIQNQKHHNSIVKWHSKLVPNIDIISFDAAVLLFATFDRNIIIGTQLVF